MVDFHILERFNHVLDFAGCKGEKYDVTGLDIKTTGWNRKNNDLCIWLCALDGRNDLLVQCRNGTSVHSIGIAVATAK